MASIGTDLLQWAGIKLQGDLGPITTYTKRATKRNRHGKRRFEKVIFPKIWLSDPTSQAQQNHRDRIRSAANLWQLLCPCMRWRWERATQSPRLALNGYNLWTFWVMTGDDDKIHTIERQTGLTLLPPIFATDYLCANCPNKG